MSHPSYRLHIQLQRARVVSPSPPPSTAPIKWLSSSRCRSGRRRIRVSPEGNPSLAQIIRRHFHFHTVTHRQADKVFTHFPGNVRQNFMPVIELHSEHGALHDGFYRSFDFHYITGHRSESSFRFFEPRTLAGRNTFGQWKVSSRRGSPNLRRPKLKPERRPLAQTAAAGDPAIHLDHDLVHEVKAQSARPFPSRRTG